ncbi:hypothetical protein SUNI508_07013 [Seiridium unicorne]|uniref:Uncharacterized protein n=1 Tax=Seiridium unicorne TaxID=138068 RepID=A0ABR2UYK3_9PEZI
MSRASQPSFTADDFSQFWYDRAKKTDDDFGQFWVGCVKKVDDDAAKILKQIEDNFPSLMLLDSRAKAHHLNAEQTTSSSVLSVSINGDTSVDVEHIDNTRPIEWQQDLDASPSKVDLSYHFKRIGLDDRRSGTAKGKESHTNAIKKLTSLPEPPKRKRRLDTGSESENEQDNKNDRIIKVPGKRAQGYHDRLLSKLPEFERRPVIMYHKGDPQNYHKNEGTNGAPSPSKGHKRRSVFVTTGRPRELAYQDPSSSRGRHHATTHTIPEDIHTRLVTEEPANISSLDDRDKRAIVEALNEAEPEAPLFISSIDQGSGHSQDALVDTEHGSRSPDANVTVHHAIPLNDDEHHSPCGTIQITHGYSMTPEAKEYFRSEAKRQERPRLYFATGIYVDKDKMFKDYPEALHISAGELNGHRFLLRGPPRDAKADGNSMAGEPRIVCAGTEPHSTPSASTVVDIRPAATATNSVEGCANIQPGNVVRDGVDLMYGRLYAMKHKDFLHLGECHRQWDYSALPLRVNTPRVIQKSPIGDVEIPDMFAAWTWAASEDKYH